MKLDGKRVFVTGDSSGIGLAIAKALLAKGARVAISGRRSAMVSSALAELRDRAGEAVGIVADIGTAEGRTETLGRALAASETNRLYGMMDRRLAKQPFLAGDAYTIADMAAYPWIVSWKRQQRNLDEFVNLRRWFENIRTRPATVRAYEKGEPSPLSQQ